jgi:hypothetical protein
MPETSPPTPLDLSAFDNLDPLPVPSRAITTVQTTEPHLLVTTDERLQPQPRFERLVEVANLNLDDLAAANALAAKIDFRNTNNLMAHGDGVQAGIAQTSRQLLAGVRVGEAKSPPVRLLLIVVRMSWRHFGSMPSQPATGIYRHRYRRRPWRRP